MYKKLSLLTLLYGVLCASAPLYSMNETGNKCIDKLLLYLQANQSISQPAQSFLKENQQKYVEFLQTQTFTITKSTISSNQEPIKTNAWDAAVGCVAGAKKENPTDFTLEYLCFVTNLFLSQKDPDFKARREENEKLERQKIKNLRLFKKLIEDMLKCEHISQKKYEKIINHTEAKQQAFADAHQKLLASIFSPQGTADDYDDFKLNLKVSFKL